MRRSVAKPPVFALHDDEGTETPGDSWRRVHDSQLSSDLESLPLFFFFLSLFLLSVLTLKRAAAPTFDPSLAMALDRSS